MSDNAFDTTAGRTPDAPISICPRTRWACPLWTHCRSCGGRYARPCDRPEKLARLLLKVRATDRFRGHAGTAEQNLDRVGLECVLGDALWDECRLIALDDAAEHGASWDDPRVRQAAHDLYDDLVANAAARANGATTPAARRRPTPTTAIRRRPAAGPASPAPPPPPTPTTSPGPCWPGRSARPAASTPVGRRERRIAGSGICRSPCFLVAEAATLTVFLSTNDSGGRGTSVVPAAAESGGAWKGSLLEADFGVGMC